MGGAVCENGDLLRWGKEFVGGKMCLESNK